MRDIEDRTSSFLVLDFDDGTLSPEEFEHIFWRKAKRGQKHSFIIHSSFNRSQDTPNRFRVIFFYQRPAQSIEDHKAVYDYVVKRLGEWGHTEGSSELDPVCKSGVQSFWIPSTNRAHPEFAFFRTYGTKTRDLERCAIDPKLCPREAEYPKTTISHPSEPAIKVGFLDKAEVIERELGTMTSGRHHLFFRFGVVLARAGLARDEIQARLFGCAGQEPKMRKKVPDVLKSLEKYGSIKC